MGFEQYTATPVELVELTEADGDENLSAATTNVSLEQLADGIRWLKDNKLSVVVSSRSVVRVQQAFFVSDDDAIWSIDRHGDAEQLTGDSLGAASCPLLLPQGAVLTAVSVLVAPAAGHAGLPAVMPVAHVVRHVMPAHTSLGSATDPSGDVAAYEVLHPIPITGLSVTIDRTLYRYSARVHGEAGANFVASMRVYGVVCTYSLTSYDAD